MSALAQFADACPSCYPGDFPAVLPDGEPEYLNGSLRASYRHEVCGAVWACWWNPEVLDWPLGRGERAA